MTHRSSHELLSNQNIIVECSLNADEVDQGLRKDGRSAACPCSRYICWRCSERLVTKWRAGAGLYQPAARVPLVVGADRVADSFFCFNHVQRTWKYDIFYALSLVHARQEELGANATLAEGGACP